jgi:hypothetical protein
VIREYRLAAKVFGAHRCTSVPPASGDYRSEPLRHYGAVQPFHHEN